MALTANFVREPVNHGDLANWYGYFMENIRLGGLGGLSIDVSNVGGDVSVSQGRIGIDNGVTKGVAIVTVAGTVDKSGGSEGLWHALEISVSGTAVTWYLTALAGETDESFMSLTMKGYYDAAKMGYYRIASRRVVAFVFLRAALALGRIVNCESGKIGFKGIERKITRSSLGVESYIYIDKMTIQFGTWNMDTTDRTTHNLSFVITGRTYTNGTVLAVIAGDTLQYSINSYGGFSVYKTDSLGVPTFVLFRETGGLFDGASYNNVIASGVLRWET